MALHQYKLAIGRLTSALSRSGRVDQISNAPGGLLLLPSKSFVRLLTDQGRPSVKSGSFTTDALSTTDSTGNVERALASMEKHAPP